MIFLICSAGIVAVLASQVALYRRIAEAEDAKIEEEKESISPESPTSCASSKKKALIIKWANPKNEFDEFVFKKDIEIYRKMYLGEGLAEEDIELLDAPKTRQEVLDKLKTYSDTLKDGDVFFIAIAAHGIRAPTTDPHEKDGFAEQIPFLKNNLRDTDYSSAVAKFNEGVYVYSFLSSCRGGGMLHSFRKYNATILSVGIDETYPNIAYKTGDKPSVVADALYKAWTKQRYSNETALLYILNRTDKVPVVANVFGSDVKNMLDMKFLGCPQPKNVTEFFNDFKGEYQHYELTVTSDKICRANHSAEPWQTPLEACAVFYDRTKELWIVRVPDEHNNPINGEIVFFKDTETGEPKFTGHVANRGSTTAHEISGHLWGGGPY
eukprot:CAMPEP_0197456840 /NCGR_PEP_ID=MMETSP1175-20131217/44423_1 /TAXON_ID=1003142 /ORGANISM="Triceratium dubium, Strain CCMP147" /LENGTH=380 /DNA_ID=CAMNT_0042991023 /DNA_START=17 /DNA_END=1162 /DNA_ORIENTATION=-